MPQFTQAYMVMQGAWKSTSPWYGETAQIGVRIGTWPDGTSIDDDGTLPVRDCEYVGTTHNETNWTVLEGWTGEPNTIGGARYFAYADQLAMAEDFWTFANSTKGLLSNQFEWKSVKISPISPTGAVATQPSLFQRKTTLAGTTTGQLPPQTSIALSFIRQIPGRRGRGRVFIPALGQSSTLSTDGTVGTSARTTLLNAGVALANAISSHGGLEIDYKLIVTSAASSLYVLPQECRVGNHFDSQRQRRDQVAETYTAQAI